jgi:putative zinc finger/helix-turn-helix YgiT family protein
MTCIKCRKTDLLEARGDFPSEIKGEPVMVSQVPCLECPNCSYRTIKGNEIAEFMRLASDAYRQKHSLLTSEEIRKRRSSLNMSQAAFANYLGGVGSASVKRWEMGKVQDKAMDKLIRVMTGAEEASDNYRKIIALQSKPQQMGSYPVTWTESKVSAWRPQHSLADPKRRIVRSACS